MNNDLSLKWLGNLLGFAGPFISYQLGRSIRPVLAGFKITHRCNLKCIHCPYWSRTGPEPGFELVMKTMERLRSMGVKILILEGGEPLLWRDKNRSVWDVASEAQKLFPCVCATTNGTIPWTGIPLDCVWVSLDGPSEVHDSVRGPGTFDRVMSNIEEYGLGRVMVSTTIGNHNVDSVPELVESLKGVVSGITIQFHYPYNGLPDPLFIDPKDRAPLLDELIALKKRGFPVANSVLSLNEMKKTKWTCHDRLLANAEPDGVILHGCYLKNRAASYCSRCGFTAHNELSLAFEGKLESIVTGMRIFFSPRGLRSKGLPNTPRTV